jgi:hypothetical protein
MTIIAGIVALFQAIPALKDLAQMFVAAWESWQKGMKADELASRARERMRTISEMDEIERRAKAEPNIVKKLEIMNELEQKHLDLYNARYK